MQDKSQQKNILSFYQIKKNPNLSLFELKQELSKIKDGINLELEQISENFTILSDKLEMAKERFDEQAPQIVLQVVEEKKQELKGKDGIQGEQGLSGKDGINGIDGVNGKDGIDGKNGVDGIDGRDGVDGIKGKDGKDGDISAIKGQTLINIINALAIKSEFQIDAKHLKNLPTTRGKKGSLHGSGITGLTAGSNITLTADGRGGYTVASTVSGFSKLAATGTVDGVNTSFTFTSAPSIIVVDQGRQMQKTSSDGTVNWSGTTTCVLTVAPTFDIYGL